MLHLFTSYNSNYLIINLNIIKEYFNKYYNYVLLKMYYRNKNKYNIESIIKKIF